MDLSFRKLTYTINRTGTRERSKHLYIPYKGTPQRNTQSRASHARKKALIGVEFSPYTRH